MEKGNSANVPNHKLVIGKRKYGNGAGKVEATTFHVICKDKDGKLHGAFVSARANVNTTAVPIEGLHPNVLDKEISIHGELVSIWEYLFRKSKKIQSMEQTNQSEEKG
eukprot:15342883-Ditylum_brightwellii.AAC.2